jgi:hypothetical protein
MKYQLSVYNRDFYNSYDEALASNAVYTTPSTIEYLTDNVRFTISGLLDLREVIQVVEKCLGSNSLEVGIVHEKLGFINLNEIISFNELKNNTSRQEK